MCCAQPALCPRQCIAPAIKWARPELAVRRSAASRCFGRECLCLDGEPSRCECRRCSLARQQRVWSVRNKVCHLASPISRPKPVNCHDAKCVDWICLCKAGVISGPDDAINPGVSCTPLRLGKKCARVRSGQRNDMLRSASPSAHANASSQR